MIFLFGHLVTNSERKKYEISWQNIYKGHLSPFFLRNFLRDVEMSSKENSKQCAGNEHALTKPDFESKRQSFPKLDELKTAYVAIRYDYV